MTCVVEDLMSTWTRRTDYHIDAQRLEPGNWLQRESQP